MNRYDDPIGGKGSRLGVLLLVAILGFGAIAIYALEGGGRATASSSQPSPSGAASMTTIVSTVTQTITIGQAVNCTVRGEVYASGLLVYGFVYDGTGQPEYPGMDVQIGAPINATTTTNYDGSFTYQWTPIINSTLTFDVTATAGQAWCVDPEAFTVG